MKRAPLIFIAATVSAISATAQERVPGADQHVTVPAAPGQPNKEMLVKPSEAMKQNKSGWILQGTRAPSSPWEKLRLTGPQPDSGTSDDTPYVPAPSGPTGPAVVGAAFVSVRGTVTAFTKNAITILQKGGRSREVALARSAFVYQGLKPGDEVVLRIPFDEGADCRTADRVDRPAPPKQAPKSKFSEAQATGS